jgi:hypothetical protein
VNVYAENRKNGKRKERSGQGNMWERNRSERLKKKEYSGIFITDQGLLSRGSFLKFSNSELMHWTREEDKLHKEKFPDFFNAL